jgi:hypothetical protein
VVDDDALFVVEKSWSARFAVSEMSVKMKTHLETLE